MVGTHNCQLSCGVRVSVFRDRSGDLFVLLVRRGMRGMRGIHGGQPRFPDGKRQPQASLLEGAWAV